MFSTRVISIVIFGFIAAFGLYTYVFKSNPIPAISTPTETVSVSPTPSEQAINQTPQSSPSITLQNRMHQITLQTNFGDITFETYDTDAPKAVQNFISLASKGFYKDVTFHRVIKGFMIQGGDPSGNGTGGPGYQFEDELNPATESYKEGYKRGVVAMANAGPNTNGSQFFIMHQDYGLPHNYTIFGKVISGLNVVDAIANIKTGANDRPIEPVVIKSVIVNPK
ncbi:MAG: peptidylprolyl isomerase [bacterium]|nr:peptidylprolyl isomerase [bacterium]